MKDEVEAKNKGGQPPKVLDAAQVSQVEKLASILNVSQLCDFLGIADNTFIAIRKRQPEVLAAYKRGKAKAIAGVGKGLLQNALDGDTTSQIFYLKTQAGWSETNKIEHSNPDGSLSPSRIELVAPSVNKAD